MFSSIVQSVPYQQRIKLTFTPDGAGKLFSQLVDFSNFKNIDLYYKWFEDDGIYLGNAFLRAYLEKDKQDQIFQIILGEVLENGSDIYRLYAPQIRPAACFQLEFSIGDGLLPDPMHVYLYN